MLLDLRPVGYPMLVICDHQVAEQLTKPSSRWNSSTPKSPTLGDIWHLTGQQSILTDEVKRQRITANASAATLTAHTGGPLEIPAPKTKPRLCAAAPSHHATYHPR